MGAPYYQLPVKELGTQVSFHAGPITKWVKASVITTQMALLAGKDADDMGSIYIREMAEELNMPVFVDGPSEMHAGKIYYPSSCLKEG